MTGSGAPGAAASASGLQSSDADFSIFELGCPAGTNDSTAPNVAQRQTPLSVSTGCSSSPPGSTTAPPLPAPTARTFYHLQQPAGPVRIVPDCYSHFVRVYYPGGPPLQFVLPENGRFAGANIPVTVALADDFAGHTNCSAKLLLNILGAVTCPNLLPSTIPTQVQNATATILAWWSFQTQTLAVGATPPLGSAPAPFPTPSPAVPPSDPVFNVPAPVPPPTNGSCVTSPLATSCLTQQSLSLSCGR